MLDESGCAKLLDFGIAKLLDDATQAQDGAAATEITPGMQGPTISPLGHDGAVAVRAMVRKSDTNKVMDALYEVGARAILVSPIQAARI